jgi:hypothetical protein
MIAVGPFARFRRYNDMLRVVELSLTKERRLQRAGSSACGGEAAEPATSVN